ncbi:hypothetical protein [Ferroplasma sp.]|uniref:hypothetical protein n=1 Tax=Ferroplasma sp. TaxID=2591003 RepID=UPI00307EE19A
MKEINKTRLKIFLIPLIILFAIIASTLPLYYIKVFDFFAVMPLIIFLSAFVIFLIGALFDFGASEYLNDLIEGKGKIREENVRNINKQQLILTLLFILDGLIYMLVGYTIYII